MAVREWLRTHRGTTGFATGVLTVVVVSGVPLAIAAIPSSSTGAFTACVNKTSGAVRIIDYQAGKRCTTRERTVGWSKGYRYRGAWSASVLYATLDVVTRNGSSYVAKTGSEGKTPSSSSGYWGLLAAAGAPGPQGSPGVASYKTASFSNTALGSPTGTAVNLFSLSYTAPTAGFAHVTGNGYCNLTGPDIDVDVSAASTPTGTNVIDGGVVHSVHAVGASEVYTGTWATDVTFAVAAGAHTAYINYIRSGAGTGSANCAGTIHVDFLTQTLP